MEEQITQAVSISTLLPADLEKIRAIVREEVQRAIDDAFKRDAIVNGKPYLNRPMKDEVK